MGPKRKVISPERLAALGPMGGWTPSEMEAFRVRMRFDRLDYCTCRGFPRHLAGHLPDTTEERIPDGLTMHLHLEDAGVVVLAITGYHPEMADG